MIKTSKLGFLALLVAGLWCMSTGLAEAAAVTKYFSFQGGKELWSWTTTGKTKFGTDVTSGTNPGEMADPAKLAWYNAGGTLDFELRNYRPGFADLNAWKTATTAKLVAFNLSGEAAGTGVLPFWGETLNVTAIGSPTVTPDYDNVGGTLQWFAQTAYRAELGADVPTWWCESIDDGIVKTNAAWSDFVEYTFDDSAIWPDGKVVLWVGGFVTDDLAGMEGGTAAYGILEGSMYRVALDDLDGDGYLSKGGVVDLEAGADDCNDSNPSIHPGAVENAGDGIDSNCNGQDDCFIATAAFGSSLDGKITALRTFRDNVLMKSHLGRVFVDLYYNYSPPVASFLDTHAAARVAVRTLLLPAVGAAWVISSHKAAMLGLMAGLVMVGLVIRRKESMKATLVVLVALGLMGLPALATAETESPVRAMLSASLLEGKSCGNTVETLLLAGYPVAEVIPAALEMCKDCSSAEIITVAIQAGADPFTVAYVSKQAGTDMDKVVAALKDAPSVASAPDEVIPPTFVKPSQPTITSIGASGTGSAWGESHWVASPSL